MGFNSGFKGLNPHLLLRPSCRKGGVYYLCTACTQVVGLQGASVSSILLRMFRYGCYADVRFSQQCGGAEGVGFPVCYATSYLPRRLEYSTSGVNSIFFSCGF